MSLILRRVNSVTKADVGLGNVPNTNIAYSSAIPADAFTTIQVSNLRSNTLADGSAPWVGHTTYSDADAQAAINADVDHGSTASHNYATVPSDVGLGNVPNEDATNPVNWDLTPTNGNFIVGNGTTFIVESGAVARTSLGLSDAATTTVSAIRSGTTKADIGLGNVTNEAQIPLTQKGTNSGVAELDASGLVPASQLPSYVDDVLEYTNQAGFPATGETGKIYVAKDTNLTFRWSGTSYVEISSSLALGETSSTAYRGDKGKTAYDHTSVTTGNPHSVTKADVGLGNVPNTNIAYSSAIPADAFTTIQVSNLRSNTLADGSAPWVGSVIGEVQGSTYTTALAKMTRLTQSEYDAITPDADTLYIIKN